MPTTDLILSGINLMLIGMGVVFSFLILLVYSMLLMSRLTSLTERGQEIVENRPITPVVNSSVGAKVELVAVISAAISRYRATQS
ncbi:MAG: OadG family protein [Chromatiales bacterium]|jgi:oxaloacetate decarboxylase gamma subunit